MYERLNRVTFSLLILHLGQVIEQLGELTRILYLEYKAIWPVSDRDFCSVSAVRVLQDGTVTFFAKHVRFFHSVF